MSLASLYICIYMCVYIYILSIPAVTQFIALRASDVSRDKGELHPFSRQFPPRLSMRLPRLQERQRATESDRERERERNVENQIKIGWNSTAIFHRFSFPFIVHLSLSLSLSLVPIRLE
jgi:hypothetical protein